jgi:hypothetical protein
MSVTDLEPVGTGDGHLGRPHEANSRFAWALFTPQPQFIEGELLAFRLHFHPPIIQISYPAAQAKFHRPSPTGLPESHALNGAFNEKTPALLKGD